MLIYYFLLLPPFLCSLIEIRGKYFNTRTKWIFILYLVLISGMRYEAGSDYFNYVLIYSKLDEYKDGLEPLFVLICRLFNMCGLGYQSLFLFCSILTISPIAYVLNKLYPKCFFQGISLYLVSFVFFEAWNTVRQGVAIAFVVLSVYYYITNTDNKKSGLSRIIPSLLCLLIALGFHHSVVLITPIVLFVVMRRYKRLPFLVMLMLLIFCIVFGRMFSSYFAILPKIIGYEDSVYWDHIEQRGVNSGLYYIYLNITVIFMVLYMKFKKVGMLQNGIVLVWAQFYFYSICIYDFFINFYIGLRFYWYFYVYLTFFIPELYKVFVKRKGLHSVYLLLYALLFVYTMKSLGSESYSNIMLQINNF